MDPGYCDEKCLEAVIDADGAAILESCQRESLGAKLGIFIRLRGRAEIQWFIASTITES